MRTTAPTSLWQRMVHLPREARDTLFLLLVIAWLIMPQVARLPVWCSAMAAGILLWRGAIALRNQTLPSRWWLVLLLSLAMAGTYYSHRTLVGRDAGVTFIVVLLALKTLELRAQRDAFVVFFLGFFTLLSNFFFSQSLPLAAAMLIGLMGLLTALVMSHMPVGKPPLIHAARTAGWMCLLGAPIMVVLFVLFPRVAPLWGVPSDAMSGRSGLSGNMKVGSIASLALDESVAMRVRFEGPAPAQRDLYFRGPVLSSFDGREWRALRSAFPPRMQLGAELQVTGAPIRYQVTLEANNRPWILVLDAAPEAPRMNGYQATMSADLQWTADKPMADLVRYSAQSYTNFTHGPTRLATGLQDFVDLPPTYNPRTLQLAAEMRRDPRWAQADAAKLVDAVMDKLRTGGYSYTLEPGVFGTHTADEFWFDRKAGFCEHIASSFVLLMRALDVPARIVTGYQGGEINSVDGFWTVRQSDAHAWSEVWIAGRGWVRVDPTSAVAPGRTGGLQRLQAPRNAVTEALAGAMGPQVALNMRAMWDAVNNRWNQWVLNYTQSRQLDLLRNIGFESPSWEDLGYVLIGIVISVSLGGAAWTLWDRHRQDPWLRLLHQAQQRLTQAGFAVPAHAPPRQMVAVLRQHQAAAYPELADWLLRLEAWRYAPAHSAPGTLQQLQRSFRHLPWPEKPPR
ncbi:MAG: transglutaminase [Burkholderiales bacterium PBB3]|nr:MAG: transglutaminase [Burkholderiales bacterium PBB3]